MPLTDKEIKRERKFLEGIPRLNIAALFLPPIWGPAHGFWATILFYPAWLLADNSFYAAWTVRTPLAIVLAALVFLILLGVTIAFALIAQPLAAHRCAERGMTKDEYLRRQRIWGVASIVVGVIMIALATYYNLEIRPGVE